jgi:hypothetical protein
MEQTLIVDSTARGNVLTGDYCRSGGLIGWADYSWTRSAVAYGDVSAGYLSYAGGLIGSAENNTRITEGKAYGSVLGGDRTPAGGIAGALLYGYSAIHSSAAHSHVEGGHFSEIGGLVGRLQSAEIRNSFATGDVRGGDESRVGGIAGHRYYSTMWNSYSTGDVAAGKKAYVGGVSGSGDYWTFNRDCYSLGELTALEGSYLGGVEGYSSYETWNVRTYAVGRQSLAPPRIAGGAICSPVTGKVTQSYWDEESTGTPTSSGWPLGALPRSTDQMTFPFSEDTYVGWDFEAIWDSGDESHANNGYPFHRWQTERHTVTYAASEGGTISGPTTQVRIPGASTAPVTAEPPPGRMFSHWSDGRTDNPRVDRNVTADFSVTAIFMPEMTQWILQ